MRPILLLSATLFSLSAVAAGDVATLNGNAFEGAEGIVAVNIAAGNFNNQSSNFIHTASEEVTIQHYSKVTVLGVSATNASADISGNAYFNASGYLSIQLAAGTSNQQSNYVIFSQSEAEVKIADLAEQTLSEQTIQPELSTESLSVTLSSSALVGAGGVIQVSQIAGTGNVARNTFQMPTIN